jgi:hypothetical protein
LSCALVSVLIKAITLCSSDAWPEAIVKTEVPPKYVLIARYMGARRVSKSAAQQAGFRRIESINRHLKVWALE